MSDQPSTGSASARLREALQELWDAVAYSHQPFHWDKTVRAALDKAKAALGAVDVPTPAPPAVWLEVIHAIAVEAMTAQSDPYAEAAKYRQALIGICNMALKAESALRADVPPPQPPQEKP